MSVWAADVGLRTGVLVRVWLRGVGVWVRSVLEEDAGCARVGALVRVSCAVVRVDCAVVFAQWATSAPRTTAQARCGVRYRSFDFGRCRWLLRN